MKKATLFIVAVLSAFFLNLTCNTTAEAARVAVIPIQINEKKVERSGDFNSYYWDVMIEKFQYPEYELMEDDKVVAVIPEEGLQSYDRNTMVGIAGKLDADIIVAMKLDEVSEEPIFNYYEPKVGCYMYGAFASFNRITGKYYFKKIQYRDRIEEMLILKTDWQQQVFASELKRYINRTLEATKKKSKF
jgi:hypothetical protein